MGSSITISVIIPAFNAEKHLGDALESVFAQTRTPTEVIVVDDGSRDRTTAIAREYAAVTLLVRENGGPGAARNTGVAAARSAYIAFLDADDTWLPRKLEVQAAYVDAHPEARLVFCLHRYRLENEEILPAHTQGAEEIEAHASPLPSSWLVAREAFQVVGLFDEVHRVGEDLEWLMRAREAGIEPHLVREELVTRRIHGANLSIDRDESRAAMFRILRERLGARRGTTE